MSSERISAENSKPNYSAPSPQADHMGIVIETLEGIVRGGWSRNDWCDFYSYDKRQYDYYVNANRWLGFLDGTPNNCVPTKLGIEFVGKSDNSRKLLLQKILLRDIVFSSARDVGHDSRREYALIIMAENKGLWNAASRTTMKRRALTVKNWLRFLDL